MADTGIWTGLQRRCELKKSLILPLNFPRMEVLHLSTKISSKKIIIRQFFQNLGGGQFPPSPATTLLQDNVPMPITRTTTTTTEHHFMQSLY